jgi:hypothetical protein
MPSTKYDKFKTVIKELDEEQPRAIYARYQGDPPTDDAIRKLWPHVLGTTPSATPGAEDEEVALCYQYGGHSGAALVLPHPSRKNLRCFKLALMSNVTKELFEEPWDPIEMKFKDVKKQTCVEDVDVYR